LNRPIVCVCFLVPWPFGLVTFQVGLNASVPVGLHPFDIARFSFYPTLSGQVCYETIAQLPVTFEYCAAPFHHRVSVLGHLLRQSFEPRYHKIVKAEFWFLSQNLVTCFAIVSLSMCKQQ
jgi:hypothetical protein